MSSEITIAGIVIPSSDWQATPDSVKAAITVLGERVSHVEEQLNQNSQNSSRPPSSDGFGKPESPQAAPKPKSKPKRKKRPKRNHCDTSATSKLYPSESCNDVHVHVPQICQHCGEQLSGIDPSPHRHQIIDIPPISAYVTEHQQHQLCCDCCGKTTRAPLPADVPSTHYGDRLAAVVAWLSGEHRQSHRMVQSLLSTLFDIEISRGSITNLRSLASEAICAPVEEAHTYIQSHRFAHSDETSFTQGNGDGGNPNKTQGWLWVLVTPLLAFFSVSLSRSQASAKSLIGEAFDGIVISDRYSAYGWLNVNQRQVCWAHLKRDFQAIEQRSGLSHRIGRNLLRRQRLLFVWWHRVRDGTLSREEFAKRVERLRASFKRELEHVSELPIGKHEKSPLAKTVRTVRQILKVERALWTFVEVDGVEPTNNAAEQALRPAVLWRKMSFGSQSKAGSEFVARILTVVTSLKAQRRNPLEYLTQACRAKRLGLKAPSLLPQTVEEAQTPITA